MEIYETIYEVPSPALTPWHNRRLARALLDAASLCERFGSRAVACWIVNLLFSSHTRARSMLVPAAQLLGSLNDDESTDLYALSEASAPFRVRSDL